MLICLEVYLYLRVSRAAIDNNMHRVANVLVPLSGCTLKMLEKHRPSPIHRRPLASARVRRGKSSCLLRLPILNMS